MSFDLKEKRMYVSVDLISRSVSPVQYFENDYSAFNSFSNSLEEAKKRNSSLSASDFAFVFVGVIRSDGVITADYRIITADDVSNISKMKEDFINDMKKNVKV